MNYRFACGINLTDIVRISCLSNSLWFHYGTSGRDDALVIHYKVEDTSKIESMLSQVEALIPAGKGGGELIEPIPVPALTKRKDTMTKSLLRWSGFVLFYILIIQISGPPEPLALEDIAPTLFKGCLLAFVYLPIFEVLYRTLSKFPMSKSVSRSDLAAPQPEHALASHRGRNILVGLAVVVIAVIGLGVLGAFTNQSTSVYITNVNYVYQCSNCAYYTWNYSVPLDYSMDAGATFSELTSIPWPSTACSTTFTSMYSETPGFTLAISPLPLVAYPGQPVDYTFTMTAPSTSYSGQVNVIVVVHSNC